MFNNCGINDNLTLILVLLLCGNCGKTVCDGNNMWLIILLLLCCNGNEGGCPAKIGCGC